jgi:hypothetical protein
VDVLMGTTRKLTSERREDLLRVLEGRFATHGRRHEGVAWADVRSRLDAHPERLWSLERMEATGGEPDVVGRDDATGEVLFVDCSAQSPTGRRSICYDQAAQDGRKKAPPANNAIAMATEMGIELLTEEQYRNLQRLGAFDTTTSSWIVTPPDIRELGGALFGDRRYDTVFVYHNGADSYYAARGFRGLLRV